MACALVSVTRAALRWSSTRKLSTLKVKNLKNRLLRPVWPLGPRFQSTTADWGGDSDGQHAALLQAIGEIEPDAEEQSQAWSQAIFPVDGGQSRMVFKNDTQPDSAVTADWGGDSDGQHAALLQAIGEIEPDAEEQSQAWSQAVFPVDGGQSSMVFKNDTQPHSAVMADWGGDSDGQHAALLQAIGEIEPDAEEQSQAWSQAIFPVDGGQSSMVFKNDTQPHSAVMADWGGDSDGQHAALLQAIGEIEPDAEEQSQAWSQAIFPVDGGQSRMVFKNDTQPDSAVTADWGGDSDGQHAALLQAIGEIEPDAEEQSQAWSQAIFPVDGGQSSMVFKNDTQPHSAVMADWGGDSDDQHAALLQAIGEIEPDAEEQSQAWSQAIFPVDGGQSSMVLKNDTQPHSAVMADWGGDSDGQHAALLQAIGEIEPDAEEQSQAWSQAIFPVDGGQSRMVFKNDTQPHSAVTADWGGDSDGQHAALLQAIGEIEPDAEEQSQAWSQAIFPVDGGQSSMVFKNDTQPHSAVTADWGGDSDGQHAALLQAIGEIEPDAEEQSQAWSQAIFPVDGGQSSMVFKNDTQPHSAVMADWGGDSDGQHAALLQAIGEIEPDAEEQSQAWSQAIFPVDGGQSSMVFKNDTQPHSVVTADWGGDSDGQHAALLQAIGEIEPDAEEQSQAWSQAIFPVDGGQSSMVFKNDTQPHSAVMADWGGDSDGQHAALLQAIGEIEPDAEEQSQAWSQAVFPVDGGQSSMVFKNDTQPHSADFQLATGGMKLKCSQKH